MSKARPEQAPVTLHHEQDAQRQYLIHPETNDLFMRTGRQVIAACQMGITVELWIEELRLMTEHVRQWCAQRHGAVRSCYVSPRGPRVVLFFAPSADRYDFELADQLVELDCELAGTFNIGTVEIHQIPWGQVDRFLDPEQARHVYGEHAKPSEPVEA